MAQKLNNSSDTELKIGSDSASLTNGRRPDGDEAEAQSGLPTHQTISAPDPQVSVPSPRAKRRIYTTEYKLKTLEAYEACSNALARNALLRREGLYYARIATWRKELRAGFLPENTHKKPLKHRADTLARDNAQLKKKLAQVEAIVELQKKVSEWLGQSILSHETDEKQL